MRQRRNCERLGRKLTHSVDVRDYPALEKPTKLP